jgi:3D-(3,5/4)-trihydroxycyclohexane-1,2-dione acylhydrolase (decyclizing)
MTVSQAIVEFLAHQWTVDGEIRERTIPGMFGIFGHGNVAGIGQALKQAAIDDPLLMPYHQARNEQAMVHESVAFARMRRRRATFASTASVGPGSTNMLTGAALATINRLPALLLPSDTFATRVADPVLQQLERVDDASISVNDAFKPLSRFFDRIQRPEQVFAALLGGLRVLTDPVETGAVTIALPEDVQAESVDVPAEFLEDRDWHIRRPAPDAGELERAIGAIRASKRPLIIAGGGVLYSDATAALVAFATAAGIPVSTTQAGVGSIEWSHPLAVGAVGATGTSVANALAAEADLIIGVGTRYSDFTTSSRTAFRNPDVRFLNLNIASFDAAKHGTQLPLVADARVTLETLTRAVSPIHANVAGVRSIAQQRNEWNAIVDSAMAPSGLALPAQAEIIGAVQAAAEAEDVVVSAAGSLPGDLHKFWRARSDLGYHVEYGYSCMGYEIAGGVGVRRAAPERDVFVMVGDGSYLMMHTELVTAVAEGIKIIVVLIQNHGYASIGNLSQTVGSQRYGTRFRFQEVDANDVLPDAYLPVDLAANAASLGIDVIRIEQTPHAIDDLGAALRAAKQSQHATLIHINSDPLIAGPDGGGWWNVPVAADSTVESTMTARRAYESAVAATRPLVGNEGEDPR